jgi:catechol 2,3-dioxygenase-like lactoylglutathione lyase family enzyme
MGNSAKPGINHIEFWVSDLARSIRFYSSFLSLIGWEKSSDVSFSNGSVTIYFIENRAVEKMNTLGVRHLCFQAVEKEQVDRVYEVLTSAEAVFIRGPILMPYSEGYYTVDFYDPDGQILEVAYTTDVTL